jgi:hypothetical protein
MLVRTINVAVALLSLAGRSLADDYKHVAAFSVDGFHGSDVEKYVAMRPSPRSPSFWKRGLNMRMRSRLRYEASLKLAVSLSDLLPSSHPIRFPVPWRSLQVLALELREYGTTTSGFGTSSRREATVLALPGQKVASFHIIMADLQ